MDNKKLLEQRNIAKKKMPNFIRQCKHIKKRLKGKWRRPKGLQSKMRLQLKGYRRSPTKGFSSPVAVKGLDRNGMKPIVVQNVSSLTSIDNKKEVIIVSAKAGKRKKIDIIKKAIEMGITITNFKNPQEYLKEIETNLKKRKTERTEKKTQKEKKKKELEKKVKEKKSESIEETLTEEEKKKQDKKEMDKMLTQTQ